MIIVHKATTKCKVMKAKNLHVSCMHGGIGMGQLSQITAKN